MNCSLPQKVHYGCIALCVVLVCFLLSGCGLAGDTEYDAAVREYEEIIDKQSGIQTTSTEDIPFALAEMAKANDDVCGWLLIPGTNVTLPIVQHGLDNAFYLDHAFDGSYSPLGCPYLELGNSKSFTDSLTVIYGHSSKSVSLAFSQLHEFEDPDFFKNNRLFFIYTTDKILIYEIISACLFNDTHLLETIGSADGYSLDELYRFVSVPNDSTVGNWIVGSSLNPDEDKVVMLSTCQIPGVEGTRFVVTGVFRGSNTINL